jgi:hypothetical protein
MRCRWCLLRQHFELCVIHMFENDHMPALNLSSTSTDKKAQPPVCNTRGASLRPDETSMPERSDACAPALSTEAWPKRGAPRAERNEITPRYAARRRAAAGISTQFLIHEEGTTTAGSSRYRCERLPGALSGIDACRSALLRRLHVK